MDAGELRAAYDALHLEGTKLAGGLTDLSQRAAVYHHVFRDSGRNHVFPLIAAHGALWARDYFAFGMRLAWCLSWQYGLDGCMREQQLAAVAVFADAMRDVNRRVCADTYANYHFTSQYRGHPSAGEIIPLSLLEALASVHAAREASRELSDQEKLAVFNAHFLYEQEYVVGPAVQNAAAQLAWPLVKFFALRPLIHFAYFPGRKWLWFHDFSSRAERIEHGLAAFDLAVHAGWGEVEAALVVYDILPPTFFVDPSQYFSRLRESLLAVT